MQVATMLVCFLCANLSLCVCPVSKQSRFSGTVTSFTLLFEADHWMHLWNAAGGTCIVAVSWHNESTRRLFKAARPRQRMEIPVSKLEAEYQNLKARRVLQHATATYWYLLFRYL